MDCARKATDGRITGLAASSLDGTGTAGLRRLRWVDAGNRGDGLWSRYALRRPVSAAAPLSI